MSDKRARRKAYKAIPEYYDAEYAHQEMLQSDVPFFLAQAGRRKRILELAVGTGRAAILMAQAGHRIVGMDNDAQMLRIAREKRDGLGIGEDRLQLVQADILGLNLAEKFDWVCVFFNTFLIFTTLQEQDEALQAVRRHLRPRGRCWLDVFQPNLALLSQESSKDLEPLAFHVPDLNRTIFRSTEVRRDPARQVQRVIFHYTWFDANGCERRQRTEFDLTFIFPRELRLLIERNGMRIERLYGNYDGSELNADSPRMIARCRLAG